MAEAGHSFELPEEQPPSLEQAGEQQTEQVEGQKAVDETVGKAQESAASKQVAQIYAQPQAPVQIPVDDDSAQQPARPRSADDQATAKLQAKDGDLIEKEWVERAKTIIAKTSTDPHEQKNQVSKMKAAYIEKRFNKAIKTDEAPAQSV